MADKEKKSGGIQERIFQIIQIGYTSDTPSLLFDIFISIVIISSVLVIFLQTFDRLQVIGGVLSTIEFLTMLVFLVEYILRVWTAQYLYPDITIDKARFKFMLSFYGIVDLVTILPYFLPFFFPSGAVAFRMFRVVRIFHLFRVNSNYDAFNVITDVLRDKLDQLVSSIFLILTLIMASSLCMYSLEHEAQPENFSNAFSGIWWAVSTLLTVGYGDIYPVTVGGRIMAIIIAFLGVGVVAIPTGIISAGFMEYYSKIKMGTYAEQDAEFMALKLNKGHEYIDKNIGNIKLPEGMYPALILRGEDIFLPSEDFSLKLGDSLMIGTTENIKMHCRMEQITLEKGHPWVGQRIKDLDISRRWYVIMVKRKDRNIRPLEETVLKQNDVVMIFVRT